ncbi:MAG: glycerol-3-phosphate 1-O-acyltransferase [Oleiphilus sp.]|nr:MAG: glycerol-3-phosphate 1-O-acyltransferase [Oleiphilus sp.]
MSRFFTLSTLLFSLCRKMMFLWVRTEVKGAEQENLELDPDKPVVYVLEYSSLSARLVLEDACIRSGLPPSQAKLQVGEDTIRRSFFFLYERLGRGAKRRQRPTVTGRLKQLVFDISENPELDVQIVPVSLFWGRSPMREKSWLQLLLADKGGLAGPFRQFLTILIHGRRTMVQFSKPFSLHDIHNDVLQDTSRTSRKTARLLRVHFRRVRQTVLGPSLSHRENLVNQLVNTPRVQQAIEEHAQTEDITIHKAREKAFKYSDEIAANLQISTIHFLERILNRLWNKIYRGITANNVDVVRDVTKDNAVIYVPCHRSHIDYLLLSSLLFAEGIMVPHIAAGINLNLPVVGPVLRRGGAFFMRRSFKGNKLYSAIFSEYIHTIFKKGYSVEYFVEGGRSRTGRTLIPKTGMVAMTVNSYLRDQEKPIAFVPVYLGYEKVLEGATYLGELRGKKKQKESIFGLFKTLKNLRKSFGKVSVNFGDPIYLESYLNRAEPNWKNDTGTEEEKPNWLPGVVNQLSQEIVTRINAAAALNPINLTALVLLSTQRQAMDARVLANLMTFFSDLIKSLPYSEQMSFAEGDGADWLEYAETMGLVDRLSNSLGDIITLRDRNAILLTYNRNNILHLFAVPALIASIIHNNNRISKQKVHALFRAIYPYIRAELYIRWDRTEIDQVFEQWLAIMAKHKLIDLEDGDILRPGIGSSLFVKLSVLARFIMPTLERYYIAIAVLTRQGSGRINAAQLEEKSTQMAERMAMLFGLNAPEFFDKSLFRNFIGVLLEKKVLTKNEEDLLVFDEQITQIAEDARLVLNAELRQSILQVTSMQ